MVALQSRARGSAALLLAVLSMVTGCGRCDRSPVDDERTATSASAATAIAPPEAAAPLPVLSAAPPTWPSFNGDEHCASVRKIAGYLRIVPAWTSDAGYFTTWHHDGGIEALEPFAAFGDDVVDGVPLDGGSPPDVRGKEVPSGFASCRYYASKEVSTTQVVGYACTSAPAPSETVARARFSEIRDTWRRCFRGTAFRERQTFPESFAFAKPLPPSHRVGCSTRIAGTTLHMDCGDSENN